MGTSEQTCNEYDRQPFHIAPCLNLREEGVEPSRSFERTALNRVCLPFHHSRVFIQLVPYVI